MHILYIFLGFVPGLEATSLMAGLAGAELLRLTGEPLGERGADPRLPAEPLLTLMGLAGGEL